MSYRRGPSPFLMLAIMILLYWLFGFKLIFFFPLFFIFGGFGMWGRCGASHYDDEWADEKPKRKRKRERYRDNEDDDITYV